MELMQTYHTLYNYNVQNIYYKSALLCPKYCPTSHKEVAFSVDFTRNIKFDNIPSVQYFEQNVFYLFFFNFFIVIILLQRSFFFEFIAYFRKNKMDEKQNICQLLLLCKVLVYDYLFRHIGTDVSIAATHESFFTFIQRKMW